DGPGISNGSKSGGFIRTRGRVIRPRGSATSTFTTAPSGNCAGSSNTICPFLMCPRYDIFSSCRNYTTFFWELQHELSGTSQGRFKAGGCRDGQRPIKQLRPFPPRASIPCDTPCSDTRLPADGWGCAEPADPNRQFSPRAA